MRKRIFTQEEIDTVIYNYNVLKMGQKRAGAQFHMGENCVKRLLQENNIPIKTLQETNISRYKINEKFFDIETSDMAYILGLLASDGCISSNENCIYIELQECDSEILEQINKKLENERPIKHYITKKGYKNSKLYFFSKYIKEKLKDYNLIPNKTYSDDFKFPLKLNKKYWLDYIRGYFDGDGCIKKTGSSLTFQLDSTQKNIIETIHDFLFINYNLDTQITYNKKENGLTVWRLYTYGENAESIFQLLYQNKECLKLNRKYQLYLQYKK